jgi:ankyrin repeat protein
VYVLRAVSVCLYLCFLQVDGRTPLIGASQNGHVEVVQALVEAGAAVDQAGVSDACAFAFGHIRERLVDTRG